jgi:SAM-dependent methyltransferase
VPPGRQPAPAGRGTAANVDSVSQRGTARQTVAGPSTTSAPDRSAAARSRSPRRRQRQRGARGRPVRLPGDRLDYVPELLERGRVRAAAEGLAVGWVEGDAEALPYPDASFDAVLSCVGVMVAPDQERAAAELVRVCRPGGTMALANWTPASLVGGRCSPPGGELCGQVSLGRHLLARSGWPPR